MRKSATPRDSPHNARQVGVGLEGSKRRLAGPVWPQMSQSTRVAAARTAWLLAPDPADAARRLLLHLKNTLAARGLALSFTIEPTTPHSPPIIRWSEAPLALTADEALRPPKLPAGRPSDERDDDANEMEARHANAGTQDLRNLEVPPSPASSLRPPHPSSLAPPPRSPLESLQRSGSSAVRAGDS
jgi:hypothetical protein